MRHRAAALLLRLQSPRTTGQCDILLVRHSSIQIYLLTQSCGRLAEEHHVDNYNAGAFFLLHDFDSSGDWSHKEVRRLYGLDDESNKDVPEQRKQEAVDTVFKLFDENGNGVIARDEFTRKDAAGIRLPDVGVRESRSAFSGSSRSAATDSASRWVRVIMATTSTNMRFTTSRSSMTRVSYFLDRAFIIFAPSSH